MTHFRNMYGQNLKRDKKQACQASVKVKTERRVFFHGPTQEKPGMLDHKQVAFRLRHRNTTLLFHRLLLLLY